MFILKPHLSTLILITFLIGLLTLTTMAQPDLITDNPATADNTLTTNNTDTTDNALPVENNSTSPITPPIPNEVSLGAPLIKPNEGNPSTPDLQISGNFVHSTAGGREMGGRETGFAPGFAGKEIRESIMPGIFRMRNRIGEINHENGAPSSATNAVLNAQLQTINTGIQQLLTSIANQPAGSDLKPQMQVLNQMLANQTALIQKINDGSTAPGANFEETEQGDHWEGGE